MNIANKANPVPPLEFRHVSVNFGDKPVLRDISFRLEPGQMIIITGAANSGKSVLLDAAIGLDQPDAGEILVEGQDIAQLGESDLLALRSSAMGIVFQEDTLFTGMTTFGNAAYRLVEHDLPEEQIKPVVHEILSFVGLENDAEKLPEELSIGMRRRLEIARGLIGWPRIMLFDEPATGLDPINTKLVMDLVTRAHDVHKISLLYSTKAMNEIRYLGQHRDGNNSTSAGNPSLGKAVSGSSQVSGAPEPAAPETLVMVLENGAVAFLGSVSEFEESTLPAVTYMTHPEEGDIIGHSLAPDPWNKRFREAASGSGDSFACRRKVRY